MKKSIICSITILTLVPGCFGRKKTIHHADDETTSYVEERDGRIFVDDVEEFVVEEGTNPFAASAAVSDDARVEIFPEDQASLSLSTIYFDFDSSAVKKSQESTLKANLEQIKKLVEEDKILVIEGHTCPIGSKSHNIQLSTIRAEVVRDWLIAHGVPAAAIKVVGRGSEFLLVPEGSKEQLAPNRRVEFREIAD